MGLPVSKPDEGSVEIAGVDVPIRGLTLVEVRKLPALGDDADAQAIAWAAGHEIAAAKAWVEGANAGDVTKLVGAIWNLSGLDEGAGFPSK